MSAIREIRRRARYVAGPVFSAALLAYFAYHAIQGDRGWLARSRLGNDLAAAQAILAAAEAERDRLERRVGLLRPDSLDPDMLDERARAVLNLAHPDDIVIFADQGPD